MIRKRLVWVVCLGVIFAAGVSTGLLVDRLTAKPARRSWLSSELNLTTEQRQQMQAIWSQVTQSRSGQRQGKRGELRQQRDEAILQILTEDQRSQYDAILQEHSRKLEELSQHRRQAFQDAVERTKQILTPQQAEKYEDIIRKRRQRGSGSPRGTRTRWPGRRHSRRGPDDTKATTTTRPTPQDGQ